MQRRASDRSVWTLILAFLLFCMVVPEAKAGPSDDSVIRLGGTSSWLGVTLRDVSGADVKTQKLPGDYGAVIASVEENSPAARAGLKSGDVLVEFAGREIWSVSELKCWVGDTPAGRTVQVKYFRDGALKFANVTIESHSHEFRIPPINIPPVEIPDFSHFQFFLGRARLGVTGQTLTPQLAHYFGVDQGKGVLVTEVKSGSPAEKAGIKAGDCIVRFGATDINSIADLQTAVSSAQAKHGAALTIIRDHHQKELKISLPDTQQEWTWPGAAIST
ncbi:MAG TPA: PDZ domain-containing protein [Terriglobia bacterium]|nr:PDZ domain-containing protein [Terriglobia bacterium]